MFRSTQGTPQGTPQGPKPGEKSTYGIRYESISSRVNPASSTHPSLGRRRNTLELIYPGFRASCCCCVRDVGSPSGRTRCRSHCFVAEVRSSLVYCSFSFFILISLDSTLLSHVFTILPFPPIILHPPTSFARAL